jgi:hypothetical protein
MDDKQDIATLIDVCILNNTHFDIANVIHKILSGKFRYTGNTWEYLKTAATTASAAEWETDVNSERFIYAIRTLVCGAFTRRSLYWADANIEKDERYTDTEVISTKLLSISSKLKDNKYICVLIKECKQFFLYE